MAKERTRTIELSDDQFQRLWTDRLTIECAGSVLGSAIMKVCEETSRKEVAFWKGLRQLTGAADGENVTINWVSRKVTVKPMEQAGGNEEQGPAGII